MIDGVLCVIPTDKSLFPPGMPDYIPAEGATHIECNSCGTTCWIGPKQKAMKTERPDVPVLCALCILELSKAMKSDDEKISMNVVTMDDIGKLRGQL
jgi:hypothetical protein